MSTAALIVGLLVSTLGFSLFLYGKKQQRVPQLLTGMLLMACPFLAIPPEWTGALSGGVLIGLWLGLRAGW